MSRLPDYRLLPILMPPVEGRPGATSSQTWCTLLPNALGMLVLTLVPRVMAGRGGTWPGKGVGERGRRPWDMRVLLKLQKERGCGWGRHPCCS